MVFNREKYKEIVKQFDEKFGSIDFEFEKTNWWPLIRIQVIYQLRLLVLKGSVDVVEKKHRDLQLPTYSINFLNRVKRFLSSNHKVSTEQRVAVFTSGNNNTTVSENGKLVNQYVEGFISYFRELEISFTLYDLNDLKNEKHSSEYSAIDLNNVYNNIVISKFNKDIAFQEQLRSINTFFYDNDIFIKDLDHSLAKTITENQSLYFSFMDHFKYFPVKRVLFYCYYNSSVMALNRAAKDSGIKTIEYSHSLISKEHYQYFGWPAMKKNMESFFPSVFWAWRDSEVNILNKTFKFLPNLTAIKGGNTYVSRFRYKKPLLNDNKIKILVTLQGIPLPDFIIDSIKENNNIVWSLRQHPRYSLDKETIDNLVQRFPEKIETAKANTLPLLELLSGSDYHMTSFSGSALEAQSIGVQNIIFGTTGKTAYAENIEQGGFFYVEDSWQLNHIIKNREKSEMNIDQVLIDDTEIRKNISQFF